MKWKRLTRIWLDRLAAPPRFSMSSTSCSLSTGSSSCHLSSISPTYSQTPSLAHSPVMFRGRLRNREDVEVWRSRLVGRRIVTRTPGIHECNDAGGYHNPTQWMPRIYWCQPAEESLDRTLRYDLQPQSPLLMLPAEIRLRIWGMVVPPQKLEELGETPIMSGDPPPPQEEWINTSAIMFCCKQLYVEIREAAVLEHTTWIEDFPRRFTLRAAEVADRGDRTYAMGRNT